MLTKTEKLAEISEMTERFFSAPADYDATDFLLDVQNIANAPEKACVDTGDTPTSALQAEADDKGRDFSSLAQPTSDEMGKALDMLEEVINQACRLTDGTLDSSALSSYANGLRFLEQHGRVVIHEQYGRRVLARFTSELEAEQGTEDVNLSDIKDLLLEMGEGLVESSGRLTERIADAGESVVEVGFNAFAYLHFVDYDGGDYYIPVSVEDLAVLLQGAPERKHEIYAYELINRDYFEQVIEPHRPVVYTVPEDAHIVRIDK